jgi:Cu(I)/Ag(I) efflux system membrane fusion protein
LNAVVIPDQAVIRSGERNIVVIALGGGYFEPREVKIGLMSEGYDQVLDGVKEGEKIVTSSQFLIDSESNLKAAISQMSGHAGMDMSKPMERGDSTGGKQYDSTKSTPMKSLEKGATPKSEKKGQQIKSDQKRKWMICKWS